MRRSWICLLLVMSLSLAIAHPASAGISVVADLDSNATNGPDTLQIEPTDTVLVYLWFTGSDSIGSFGLTLGDTSGALSWVEESAASVYNTPNGWANVPVQQDSLGWLLLQATDFSFQAPIQVPCEFAQLKFFITTGDSCGTVEGNLDRSGWFNQDLGEGSFTSFEGPTICVDSVLDGGGDGGGGGGGNDDDVPDDGDGDGNGGGEDSGTRCSYDPEMPDSLKTVWVVDDTGTVGVNCDCIDIQACIDSADSGDTVCVNPGTYDDLWQVPYVWNLPTRSHITSRATFAILKSGIVVKSSAGPDSTFVGVEDQQTLHVCVIISDSTKAQITPIENVVVEGFTFQYGYTEFFTPAQAEGAGSMLVNRGLSSVVIRENVFQDNRGSHGGAIRTYGEPTIQENVFRRNKVKGGFNHQGGAIQVSGGRNPTHPRPRIEGNLFEDNGVDSSTTGGCLGGVLSLESAGAFFIDNQLRRNNASHGGAIWFKSLCDPVIKFNVVEQCTASAGGGVIWSSSTDTLEICGNTFRENVSLNGNGGALKLKGTNGIIRRNRFIRNSAVEGGAIFLSDDAMPLIERNFFDSCSADSMGGAIAVDTISGVDSVRIRANTFVDNNVAGGKGGAVALRNATSILDDNFFLKSLAEEGGALSLVHGSTALVEHNVFDSCMASVSGAAIAIGSEEMTGTMRVRNNTFVCNVAPDNKGAALYTAAPSFVMSFMRNIVAFSESSGVVLDHDDASVDSFGCNDFYENSGLDYIGIDEEEEITDTLFSADPKLCEGNSCSLYTLDLTSMCAPGSVCTELIGARGTCSDCSIISSLCEYQISTGIVATDRPTLSLEVPGLIARPNPFNSTVRLFFYNQVSRGRVRITIYDVQGRMVYQFPEEWAQEGWMSRVWRGNNREGSAVASGVYFAQIRDRKSQRTCKILLVR